MTPPRRWFRFSLRTMLIVMTLALAAAAQFQYQNSRVETMEVCVEVDPDTHAMMPVERTVGGQFVLKPRPWALAVAAAVLVIGQIRGRQLPISTAPRPKPTGPDLTSG